MRVFEQRFFVQQRLLLKKENGAKENKLSNAEEPNGLVCMEFVLSFSELKFSLCCSSKYC